MHILCVARAICDPLAANSRPETDKHLKIALHRSKIHGNGVAVIKPLKKGEEIVEYTGKIRTHDAVDDDYGDKDDGHTFLFTLNDEFVIDGNIHGNIARWINHGCDPNCEAFIVEDPEGDKRKDRVVICAKRNIIVGEELTYDYDIEVDEAITPEEKKLWACRCGAPNCKGTMLTWKDEAIATRPEEYLAA